MQLKHLITVFTPTYNRSDLLKKLYNSLLQQTDKDFEWLIVDDGSSDTTPEFVRGILLEKKLNVRYIRQENGGKHTAINRGVKEANGEYFFNVDSDDILPNDAVGKIKNLIIFQKSKFPMLGGVACRKAHFDGALVGSEVPNAPLVADSYSIRYQYRVIGDLAEIFQTKVLALFPFPEGNNERFCPEVLVWNRIADKFDLLYTNEIVYLCEYIEGGLTANITKVRMESPFNTCQTYLELFKSNKIGKKQKFKALINFWRFYFAAREDKQSKINTPKSSLNFAAKSIGKLMNKKDKKRVYESVASH